MTARRAEQIAQVYDEKESARCDMRNANDITAALDEHGFAILPELVNTASRAVRRRYPFPLDHQYGALRLRSW